MTDWYWYAGSSEEYYDYGPFALKEHAIEAVRENLDYGYIVEAKKAPLKISDRFCGETFMIDTDERAEELHDEDGNPVFVANKAQIEDLERRVRKALDEWQEANALTFETYWFSDSRNHEFLPMLEEEET